MRMDFRSDKRGYILILECDLFGAYTLDRHWFGLHNRRGGFKRQVFLDGGEAMKEVNRIIRARRRRGYNALQP